MLPKTHLEIFYVSSILLMEYPYIMISVVQIFLMDRYFTSVIIADWTTQKDVTTVGTIHMDLIGIPASIKM